MQSRRLPFVEEILAQSWGTLISEIGFDECSS